MILETLQFQGICENTTHSSFFTPFFFPHPQVEALLASEDYGKDLASVNNLLKKHQLLEADISAHEVLLSLFVLEHNSE